MFTSKGNSIYDETGKVVCTLPTSTVAARKLVIAANKTRIMDIPVSEKKIGDLVIEIGNTKTIIDTLTAEIKRLTVPPVVVPPSVVVPPVVVPPIVSGQVTSLNEVTAQLRAGKSVKLKPGIYIGQLDLQYLTGPVTLDATDVSLTGAVRMQDTKGLTIIGLNVKGQIYTMAGSRDIVLSKVSVIGDHTINGLDFGLGIGNLSILKCKFTDNLCGAVIVAQGDLIIEDTEVFGFGDDGFKIAFDKPDSIKTIRRNTFGIPFETGLGYHSDAIQFTAIDIDSNVPYDFLVLEDNVAFENHDLSTASMQGFCSFQDRSAFGRMFRNASVQRNLIMCSYGQGLTFFNINGAIFANNTVINVLTSQPNIPWMQIGTMRKQGVISDISNLHSIADVNVPRLFNWDGIEQPKTRSDVERILTRK